MFYVGAYMDDKSDEDAYRFVGWSRSEFAIRTYNVAGHHGGPFYEHYMIFEYDVDDLDEFVKLIEHEWGECILGGDEDDRYIGISETEWGDCISLTNEEYNELIALTDIDYDVGHQHMQTLYMYISENVSNIMRNKEITLFVGWLFSRYIDIFRGALRGSWSVDERLDKVQSFICNMKDEFFLE